MPIRSVIIDDVQLNIEALTDVLEEIGSDVSVLGTAMNGTEALKIINQLKPDLVFLDVEMPDMNGFEVLAALDRIDFQTIFVTAHSHYAIQAIRFNALDYLLKPVDPKELTLALKRFRSKDHANQNQEQVRQAIHNMQQEHVQDQVLYMPTQEGGIKMYLKEIVKIEGERNYSTIHLVNGKKKLTSKTLGYFEDILEGKGFFRCHRSFIVNHHGIDKLRGDAFLMKDTTETPISRRRKAASKLWFASF